MVRMINSLTEEEEENKEVINISTMIENEIDAYIKHTIKTYDKFITNVFF